MNMPDCEYIILVDYSLNYQTTGIIYTLKEKIPYAGGLVGIKSNLQHTPFIPTM